MPARVNLLTNFLDRSADLRGAAAAAADATSKLDYREMRGAAARIAAELAANGVARGDRVVLLIENSVSFCAAFWGILAAGAVAVPLNPGTKAGKLAFVLDDCAPAALVVDRKVEDVSHAAGGTGIPTLVRGTPGEPGGLDRLILSATSDEPLPPCSVIDQDLAAIIYTSGSTGRPKGVMLSHLNMTSAARSVALYLGYREDDRVFCAVPMTFDYGLHQMTMAALTGACLLPEPSFAQPLFSLKRMSEARATVFPVVPSMVPLVERLAERFDLSSVRLVTSTAAALHADHIDAIGRMLPAATLFSMYGLTECHRCTYLHPMHLDTRKTSIGKAIPNTEMWVVDENGVRHDHSAVGELVIRGSTVMKGYWNNPEETSRRLRPGPFPGELVLYTGDTCRLDEEGFLYFVSRTDDILKVRGEKVVPAEVEATLAAHPDVAEACVVGEAHAVYGQRCAGFVSLRPGAKTSPFALVDWCRERLDPHAVPARVVIVKALPRTQNGKFDRAALGAAEAVHPETESERSQ